MKDYKEINYKNNFLHQVIIRIDFLQFYDTEKIFTNDIETAISRHFPFSGMIQILRFNTLTEHYESESAEPAQKFVQKEGRQKEYLTKDKQNKVILSNKYLIFEINKYQNFEKVSEYLKDILAILFSQKSINTNRVGIRYINIIDSKKNRIYMKYFTPEIASALKSTQIEESQIKLVRSMHTSEYSVSGMTLNFRYGLYNPQYPNPLLDDNSFALDYDCFVGETFNSAEDVIETIENGHNHIQELFESSITDAFRKVMGDE